MKKLLTQYSAYHLWANRVMIDFVLALPVELHEKTVKGSFTSLSKTLLHMWDAESIWWQRMKMLEQIYVPSESCCSDIKDITDGLMKQSKQWHEWTLNAQEYMFDHEFIYHNSKKEKYKQPVYQVLMQVFNHATYHRGQLVNTARQLGVNEIPQTDFIIWGRKKS